MPTGTTPCPKLDSTYVHDGHEVKWTGRTAEKSSSSSLRTVPDRVKYLYEIRPTNPDMDWKKWVRFDDLYEVRDGTDGTGNP